MTTYILRDYQRESVDKAMAHIAAAFGTDDHGLLVLPTGAGKSLIIAEIVRRCMESAQDTRVLCLTHVKELVEQNAEKAAALLGAEHVGVHNAGLNRRETGLPLIVGSVQSAFRDPAKFGHVHMLLVDECHRIQRQDGGMYRAVIKGLLAANPNLVIIGLTATPFRADGTGHLHIGDDALFRSIIYEVRIETLVEQGYLAPLVAKGTDAHYNLAGISTQLGDFAKGELERAVIEQTSCTEAALRETLRRAGDRKSWLVFAVSVKHAEQVSELLWNLEVSNAVVTGETPSEERRMAVERFKSGDLRALVNVYVLTTGFDAPGTDCLVMLRPTQSAVLHVQMAGRGMRIAPGKQNCLYLDFGGNVERMGPVTEPTVKKASGKGSAPVKKCPECQSLVPTGLKACPDCGYVWPLRAVSVDETPSVANPMGSRADRYPVEITSYARHEKRDRSGPPSMRVTYRTGIVSSYSEWICFEHQGYARDKARKWWRDRGGDSPVPTTVDEALERAYMELWSPHWVTIKDERGSDGRSWPRVVRAWCDEPVSPREPGSDDVADKPRSDIKWEATPF